MSAESPPPDAYYLRSERGVVGPVAALVLRRWFADGRLGPRTPVSLDARNWQALETVPELARFVSPDEFDDRSADRATRHERCGRRLRRYGYAFHALTVAGTVFGMAAVYAVVVCATREIWPGFPFLTAGLLAVVPCLLLGAWAGHAAGHAAAAAVSGLSPGERRTFARELDWTRRDVAWPDWFQRWLYTGDWLAHPGYVRREDYVAVFTDRDPSRAAEEWDREWQAAWGAGPGGCFEVGTVRCECFRVPAWPAWADALPAAADSQTLRRLGGQAWLEQLSAHAAGQFDDDAALDESGWRFWLREGEGGHRLLLAAWSAPGAFSRERVREAVERARQSSRRESA